ncbi:peptidase M16 inactive domain-containing protein [Besnoitia besnoiti]|uniref:Peptidase M16 inactive domain-containing protein n=1 Tax=Besnoitia besnoiti TaxID=94643 RepID=A0A2A9MH82_BESBE|nr:peptidase M16 inactive domain-containing protein [Besnoitia besnoiti]PFH35013.1 peptidase M16 inactive domain-containing protein [Besnoitia besnoiti]
MTISGASSPLLSSPSSSPPGARLALPAARGVCLKSFLERRVGTISSLFSSSPLHAAAAITVVAAVASHAPSLAPLLASLCVPSAPASAVSLAIPSPQAQIASFVVSNGGFASERNGARSRAVASSSAFSTCEPGFASQYLFSSPLQPDSCRPVFSSSYPHAWPVRPFSVMPAAAITPPGSPAAAPSGIASEPTGAASTSGKSLFASKPPVSHPAFDVLSQEVVPELQLEATQYIHRQTGARVMSIRVPEKEKEKVFCICLRTPVSDSTGVPHILEHSVLCGSKKYPLKEPFADLIKGSLYSFLNAFTYPDRTCYPVSSVNDKDFYNLAGVYIDAVFQPRAVHDPTVLSQEGWRLEATEATSGKTPQAETADQIRLRGDEGEEFADTAAQSKTDLKYQGVVLNEMKGVYSSPLERLERTRMEALFPDIATYRCDSGGNPEQIKTLTFSQFTAFYHRLYHPSNAKIFFWGSDDVMRRLDFVDENLRDLDETKNRDPSIEASTAIPTQPPLPGPVRVQQTYPAPKEQLEDIVSVSWVLDPANFATLSTTERLALGVLSHLLVGTSAGPLYRALMESNLGKEVVGGIDDDLKHVVFSAGLKGEARDAQESEPIAERVEKIILECLQKHAAEGFKEDAVEASVNSVEFQLREFNTGTFPRGLAVILQMMSDWTQDRDPLGSLRFEAPLEELKKQLKAGEPVFERLLYRHFVSNSHRATVHMKADPDEETRREQQEEEEIQRIRATMSKDEIEDLKRQTKDLKAKQMAEDPPEAVATLPTLTRKDVDKEDAEIPTIIRPYLGGRASLLLHPLPTAGILYADWAFPLHDLTLDELRYLSLFARFLTEAGTSTKSETALVHHIGRYTGGIASLSDIRTIGARGDRIADPYDAVGYFVVKGKAVRTRIPELFATMAEVLTDCNLGNARRGKEILKEMVAATESMFLHSGHLIGSLRIGATLTAAGYVAEQRAGYSYLQFVKELRAQAETDWAPIEAKLRGIREKLRRAKTEQILVNLTADEATLEAATSMEQPGGEALHAALSSVRLSGPDNGVFAPVLDGKHPVKPCTWALEMKERNSLLNVVEEGKLGEGFVVPTQVNYVCLGGRLFDTGEPFRGEYSVATRALSTGYLWDNVRVVGGAYGSSFRSDSSGTFLFASYRDPQLAATLERYRGAAEGLRQFAKDVDERGLDRAVLGVIRDLDQPLPNDQKGYTALWQTVAGRTKEDRRRHRKQVLETTVDAISSFADRLGQQLENGGEGEVARKRELEEYELERERIASSALASGDEAGKDASEKRRLVSVVVGSKRAFEEASRQDPSVAYNLKTVMGRGTNEL